MNTEKTEDTTITRQTSKKRIRGAKLGSLLEVEEDVSRPKILALQFLNKLYNLWTRSHNVNKIFVLWRIKL